MRTRGRISAQARTALQPTYERPDPPPELNARQAQEWRAIVERMPAGWFLRETHGMLVSLVRLTDRSDHVAAQLDRMQKSKLTETPEYAGLVAKEINLSRAIANLQTKMRITQQSTSSEYKIKTRGPKLTRAKRANGDQDDQGWDSARQLRLGLGDADNEREEA